MKSSVVFWLPGPPCPAPCVALLPTRPWSARSRPAWPLSLAPGPLPDRFHLLPPPCPSYHQQPLLSGPAVTDHRGRPILLQKERMIPPPLVSATKRCDGLVLLSR